MNSLGISFLNKKNMKTKLKLGVLLFFAVVVETSCNTQAAKSITPQITIVLTNDMCYFNQLTQRRECFNWV